MLRILGSPRTLCDGITRRDFLHIGGLGAFGVGLSDLFRLEKLQAAGSETKGSFGKAKSCILLFPYGSPPQHETFDPKPDAPAEVQGEMKAIPTNVPGIQVCDHLPRIARVMDRVTVVRSMTHPYPQHGVAYAVSGIPTYTPTLETVPRDSRHWPFIGSIVDYLDERRTREVAPPVPRNVGLPWRMASKADISPLAGPYAAFLGQAYDPVWMDFVGDGTKIAPRNTQTQKRDYHDPFMGIRADGRFQFSPDAQLSPDVSGERFHLRRSLLSQLDRAREILGAGQKTQGFDKYRELAFSMLTSNKVRDALDIDREPRKMRDAYGMTLFGQACLAARRLVEAGSRFVTVFWDVYGASSPTAHGIRTSTITRV